MTGRAPAATFRAASHQAALERDGWFAIEDILDDRALAPLDRCFAEAEKLYRVSFYAGTMAMRSNLAHRVRAAEAFQEALGPLAAELLIDYRQYYGGFGVKGPTGDQAILDLHQDITMVPYDGARTSVTLWAPLCDVDERNGCVAVFPGSHRLNRLPRAAGADFAFPAAERTIIDHHLVPVPLRRGSLLVMDQALMHRSGPNLTDTPRVAVMGMFRPEESGLVYYHRVPDPAGWMLEVHSVPDDFYLHHQLGTRPEGTHIIGRVPEQVAPEPQLEPSPAGPEIEARCPQPS